MELTRETLGRYPAPGNFFDGVLVPIEHGDTCNGWPDLATYRAWATTELYADNGFRAATCANYCELVPSACSIKALLGEKKVQYCLP